MTQFVCHGLIHDPTLDVGAGGQIGQSGLFRDIG